MQTLRDASRMLTPVGLTVLRIVAGVIMTIHGLTKVVEFPLWTQVVSALGPPAPEVLAGLSVAAELGGGIGLVVGLLTPIAAFGVLLDLIVAIAVVHAGNGLFVQNGGFEYALTMACVALFFVFRGGGPFSLDHAIFRARREAPREEAPPPIGREAHA